MDDNKDIGRTGPYERAVQWVTDRVKPYLHKTTDEFVKKSVAKNAKDNPHYARMIEFEVRRRGDGAGLTQDVSEPLVWIGLKSALAVTLEVMMRPLREKKFRWKWIGHTAALSIIAQQALELFRVLPRYKAGLQGSLEMAKDRWRSVEETGVDPFSSQTREINVTSRPPEKTGRGFSKSIKPKPISPEAIEQSRAAAATNNEIARQ